MPDTSRVQIVHGAQERGKDIIFYTRGGFSEEVLCACIIKNSRVSGSVSGSKSARQLLLQAEQALEERFIDEAGSSVAVQRVYIITPYDATPATIESIAGKLASRRGQVSFISRPRLVDLFNMHWPEFLEIGGSERPLDSVRIALVNCNDELLSWLKDDTTRLLQLGPQGLENLVLERLQSMGMAAHTIGRANTPDGGIDIIARFVDPVDSLMVVQIESHVTWSERTGVGKARELFGTTSNGPFNFGLLVTNTHFTKNANEYLDSVATKIRRAAHPELCQWLVGNLLTQPTPESRLPATITVPGGPEIAVPKGVILDGRGRRVIVR